MTTLSPWFNIFFPSNYDPFTLLAAALHGTAHPYSCAKGLPAAEMPFCNGKLAVADRVRISALHNTALSLESSVKYRNHDCKITGEKREGEETVHTPLEAPEAMRTHPACSHIPNPDRKMFCAMLLVTDNMVQQTFSTLEDHSFNDNTIVVYSVDNGGAVGAGGASNMPLRGRKGSVFEGCIRSAAWIWGCLFVGRRRHAPKRRAARPTLECCTWSTGSLPSRR